MYERSDMILVRFIARKIAGDISVNTITSILPDLPLRGCNIPDAKSLEITRHIENLSVVRTVEDLIDSSTSEL